MIAAKTGPLPRNRISIVTFPRWAIALGSIGVGVWGTVAPRQLAPVMGDDPTLARTLAVRDAVIGAVLIRWSGPVPLILRTAADVSDAIRLRRHSPIPAAAALAFGLLSLATAAASLSMSKLDASGTSRRQEA